MCNVAIYIRYPYDGDGGIDVIKELKDFASSKEDWNVKEVFQDFNCSAKKEKPEFEKLLNLCSKNEFDIILVMSIHHITRNTIDFLKLERTLADYGVKIYSKYQDSYVEIIECLNNKSIENLASFLTAKPTEEDKINERYSEMQLRLETLQKIRMCIGECIVELKDKDYLIEAYEILNDLERNVWRYINEGKF